MKLVKLISLILAALMCLAVLASCADSTDEETVHTRADSDESSDEGSFASADYNGEDFTVLYVGWHGYYGGEYIDADSLTGETINDAVYARNMAVEEKYNINIVERDEEEGSPATVLQQFYMAGDFCFDLIYGWCWKLGMCITDNYLMDFYDLDACDYSRDYWSPRSIENMTMNNHLYITCPDISMDKIDWSQLFFFNKNIYEDYNLESEFGNPYELVYNGEWTIDKYFAMGQSISNDVNGDGLYNREDVVGFGLDDGGWTYISCGINLTEPDANGVPVLSFYSEKFLDIITRVKSVYTDENQIDGEEASADYSGEGDGFKYMRSIFSEDHCLFLQGTPQITREFRDMKSEYGILPMPKYDEHQEEYYTDLDYNCCMFALPMTYNQTVSNAGAERTGNVVEYMAYKSSELLLPTYYDTLIKGQRLAGDDDSNMLDIVRDCCNIQTTRACGCFCDESGGEAMIKVINSMYSKPNSATSTYKRQEKKLQKVIDNFYEELTKMDAKNQKNSES